MTNEQFEELIAVLKTIAFAVAHTSTNSGALPSSMIINSINRDAQGGLSKLQAPEWEREPELIEPLEEIDPQTGYSYYIKRSPKMKHLCGYVKVNEDHPCFGKEYDDLYDIIEVHGDLTYSEDHLPCKDSNPDEWYIGFDCAHCIDIIPVIWNTASSSYLHNQATYATYKNIEFVRNECKKLCKQLKEINNKHLT